jgi:hypothetical protein
MIRKITEREIVVSRDDLEMVTGILAEFNADVVGKFCSPVSKNIVRLCILSELDDFEELLEWFDKHYDGMISILE